MLKNAALEYAKRGLGIFPLHPKSKKPLLNEWTSYQSTMATATQITQWWTEEPNANIALPTGQVNGVVVVDLDGLEGLATGKKLGLYSPVQSITGRLEGGRQLFYKWPGERVCGTVGKFPGLDLRGDGNYVVLPPSVHPSGKRYQWIGGSGVLDVTKLPPFPTALFTVLSATPSSTISRVEGWITESLKSLSEGNRNDTFTRIAGKLRASGLGPDDIYALLEESAKGSGFDLYELRTITRSVARYQPKHSSYEMGSTGVKKLTVKTWTNSKDEYEKRKKLNGSIEFKSGFTIYDRVTGGLQRGDLTVIAARTGIGKTNVISHISRQLIRDGKSVLILSTEMSFARIWDRIGLEAIKTDRLTVCDDLQPDDRSIKELIAESKPDVVIFDHINHIGDDYEKLSSFIHSLKALAVEFNIPIVVTAQLSRAADQVDMRTQKRLPVSMSMIKGSGTIEQVAAQVMLVSQIASDETQIDLEVIIAKNRFGEQDKFYLKLMKNPWRLEEA